MSAYSPFALIGSITAPSVVIPADSPFFHNGPINYPPEGGDIPLFATKSIYEPNGDILLIGTAPDPSKPGYSVSINTIQSSQSFAITRLLPDYTLDASFGNGGTVVTSFGDAGLDQAQDVLVQPDGKIVVVGSANITGNEADSGFMGTTYAGLSSGFAIVRYNADGSLDSSFGNDSKVLSSFGGSFAGANAVALQPDGKLVVVGYSEGVTSGQYLDGQTGMLQELPSGGFGGQLFTVARYNHDGSLDSTFAQGGVSLINLDNSEISSAEGVTIQADGKIFVQGFVEDTNPFASGVHSMLVLAYPDPNQGSVGIQYNQDGTLDASFGDGSFGTGGIQFGAQFAVSNGPAYSIGPSETNPTPSSNPPAAPPTSTTPPAPTPATPPTFIAYVTTPASPSDPTTGPGAPPADLTALYLSALSVSGGAPIGGLPLPGGGYGVIALATPAEIAAVPNQPAAGDPFRTQISGGGSVIIVDGPTDPFAPQTTGDYVPNAAFDTAGEPVSPPIEHPLAPSAVMDIVFARMPFGNEGFQRSELRFDLTENADAASPLPPVVTVAVGAVAEPRSLKLLESVSFGLVGIGLAGAVPRRKKEKSLWRLV